jgi:hypothetical protein
MVIIKNIFKIIDIFDMMDKDDIETYLREAKEDWINTPIEDTDGKEIDYTGYKAVLVKAKKFEKNWLAGVLICCVQFLAVRYLNNLLSTKSPLDQFKD